MDIVAVVVFIYACYLLCGIRKLLVKIHDETEVNKSNFADYFKDHLDNHCSQDD